VGPAVQKQPVLPATQPANPYTYPPSPAPHSNPLADSWARIKAWLNREYPELADTLNYGILPNDLAHIESQFGFPLPQVLRDSYLICNGQEPESAAGCSDGLFFGLRLLPLEDVYDEWRFWRQVDSDPATGANQALKQLMHSIPPNWVRKQYSLAGWIPLIADRAGNYIGVDLNPAQGGHVGQVIVFGRDFDTKVVLWRGDGPSGWANWLAAFADELDSGDSFELGPQQVSDDSEDELGYESYFYDGKGRGHGDGGGDSGAISSLRLTGEYKGWNVMDAWADRSLRRWHQAGLITDPLPNGHPKEKVRTSSPACIISSIHFRIHTNSVSLLWMSIAVPAPKFLFQFSPMSTNPYPLPLTLENALHIVYPPFPSQNLLSRGLSFFRLFQTSSNLPHSQTRLEKI